jgi:hypothetical protein
MKTMLLLALLAALICYYHGPSKPAMAVIDTGAQRPPSGAMTQEIVVAHTSAYRDRWKTGPNAFTDLKTGPDAQVSFEPFAPSEQANWNQSHGYTVVSGAGIRPH